MKAGGQELVDKLDNAMRRRDEELAEADDEEAAQQVLECAICVEPSNNPTITCTFPRAQALHSADAEE